MSIDDDSFDVEAFLKDDPATSAAFGRFSVWAYNTSEERDRLQREVNILKAAIKIVGHPLQVVSDRKVVPEHHLPPHEPDLGEG